MIPFRPRTVRVTVPLWAALLILAAWALLEGANFLATPVQAAEIVLEQARTEVYFSPDGGGEKAIIRALDATREEALVMVFSFTNKNIRAALERAEKRGVDVQILADDGLVHDPKFKPLARMFVDTVEGLAHNKVMILDKTRVITGSFNFTKAAEERNSENLLIITDPGLARLYRDNWLARRATAKPWPSQR